MYITIIAFNKFHGSKPLRLDGIVKLVKEPDNKYDAEAIACEMRYFGKIGYLANSVNSVIKGCMSSGRVYDKIEDEYFARIKFITDHNAIAKVLTSDEFIEEIENPESDVHYLSENPAELDIEYIKKHY
ncbi:HIRAN domain-containing protein [Methanobrevibacter sp.]|uniref:HIRAN domain-containing protein n=1 Tax=Methanobrevibacter sp. TaxID=66852 RepID=UPI0025E688EE|nr:HIRAN domain-containing protein [uncultured Methanobrevibacter sp.]